MPAERPGIDARLGAWREQGADRLDPLRFALMAAMARRAASHDGAVRQRLDARLHELAEAYATLVADPAGATPSRQVGESPLQPLLAQFAAAPRRDAMPQAEPTAPIRAAAASAVAAPLPVLDEFQQLWSRIRIDSLLRQCLDALPDDAGPLHSRVLTYRAMALMRDVSPGYLQHFVAYVDVLTWMEPWGSRSAAGSDADHAAGARKPARAGAGRRKKQPAEPPDQA